ncbi:MAG: hypothetical protein ACREWG_15405 [Gammaproteobacteria bacterium]
MPKPIGVGRDQRYERKDSAPGQCCHLGGLNRIGERPEEITIGLVECAVR